MKQEEDDISRELSCSKLQLRVALNCFVQSLQQVMVHLGHPGGDHLTDTTHHHFWSVPPGCVEANSWSQLSDKSCQCGAVTNTNSGLEFVFVNKESNQCGDKCNETINEVSSDSHSVQLWDSLAVHTSALQNAVLTANMLLGVHSYIQDTN